MDKTPEEYERSQTGSLVYFYDEGDEGIFSDNSTTSRTANFDVNYQLNHRHLLKSGFTFTKHNMGLYTEEEPWQGGTNLKMILPSPLQKGPSTSKTKLNMTFLFST